MAFADVRLVDSDIVSQWIDLSNTNVAVLHSPVSVAERWAGAAE
jgi:hypothetical protein